MISHLIHYILKESKLRMCIMICLFTYSHVGSLSWFLILL